MKLKLLFVILLVLAVAANAEDRHGGRNDHRPNYGHGGGYNNHGYGHGGGYNNHGYGHGGGHHGGGSSWLFNFDLSPLFPPSYAPRPYYAPPPTVYIRSYYVTYTIFNYGRRSRSGSMNIEIYDNDEPYAEVYRRLGLDRDGVSYSDRNVYCSIEYIRER